jgi:hypothetical protein
MVVLSSGREMTMTLAPGPYPRPEELEQAAVQEREHELDDAAEHERIKEEGVPRRHPFRALLAKLRRKH